MLRNREKDGGRADRFLPLRMDNLNQLLVKSGYSYAQIGKKGVVDPKTVERAYKFGRATVRTVNALLKAFQITDPDFLVQDWNLGNAPSGKELRIIIKVAAHLEDFMKAKQDESFAVLLKQIAAASGVLAVIEIRPGCTEIEMTADADDVQRIYEAFEAGKLDHLGVVSISSELGTEYRNVKSTLAEPRNIYQSLYKINTIHISTPFGLISFACGLIVQSLLFVRILGGGAAAVAVPIRLKLSNLEIAIISLGVMSGIFGIILSLSSWKRWYLPLIGIIGCLMVLAV